MDLLACAKCERRFYAPGDGPFPRRCPQCGGGIGLALHRITSIPLDARSLEARVKSRGMPTATAMVEGMESHQGGSRDRAD